MLDDYEFYQGVVLRQLAVENDYSLSVSFRPFVREGRINAFVMNMEHKFPDSFMVFVCGTDGLVTLSLADLHSIVSFQESENAWVSISRPPRTQYEVAGNRGELGYKVSRGIGTIPETLKTRVRERYATG
jgi:hypothetical protein